MRLWISELLSHAEAVEYRSVAANDVATRTNGEAHQRPDANDQAWPKPRAMHLFFVGNLVTPTATAQRSLHFRVIRRGSGEGTTSGCKAQCGPPSG